MLLFIAFSLYAVCFAAAADLSRRIGASSSLTGLGWFLGVPIFAWISAVGLQKRRSRSERLPLWGYVGATVAPTLFIVAPFLMNTAI